MPAAQLLWAFIICGFFLLIFGPFILRLPEPGKIVEKGRKRAKQSGPAFFVLPFPGNGALARGRRRREEERRAHRDEIAILSREISSLRGLPIVDPRIALREEKVQRRAELEVKLRESEEFERSMDEFKTVEQIFAEARFN